MNALLLPWAPVAAFLAMVAAALAIYDIGIDINASVVFLTFALIAILGWGVVLSIGSRTLRLPHKQAFRFWRTVSVVIVASNLLEYALFGVPVFGDVLYVEFGLPILHHVSVASWLLVFTLRYLRGRWFKAAGWIVALVNPILMFNRDVLLLTLFSMATVLWIDKRIKRVHLLLALAALGLLFGFLGEARSPLSLQNIPLPFAIDIDQWDSLLVWPLVYLTSSSFNMLFNFQSLRLDFYLENINVFPEAFSWAAMTHTYAAIPVFYMAITAFLGILRRAALRNADLTPLYIYFLYQSYMSVFATKVGTTDSLFMVGLFVVVATRRRLQVRQGWQPSHQRHSTPAPNV